jgi:hypothetical protein
MSAGRDKKSLRRECAVLVVEVKVTRPCRKMEELALHTLVL